MLKEFEGQMPKIDKKAHAFESADLIGKVEMKEYSSAWFNVTIRGDVNRIEVGRYSNICWSWCYPARLYCGRSLPDRDACYRT